MAKPHDGSDFKHRQRILPQYQLMALTKKRLKFTLILHILLNFLMAAKLLPTVLDLLNIFWQPLEELYIPMAKPWEWIWFSSFVLALLTYRSIRSNNTLQLKLFLLTTLCNCIAPLFYCAYIYSSDFIAYVRTKDAQKASEVWRDYPTALFWYIFIGVACQVHAFELYFGWELLKSMETGQRVINKKK